MIDDDRLAELEQIALDRFTNESKNIKTIMKELTRAEMKEYEELGGLNK